MGDWRIRPTTIDNWDEDIDTILSIDENGTNDLKSLLKIKKKDPFLFNLHALNILNRKILDPNNRWFTITGVAMDRPDFPSFKDNILTIKYTHWEDGCFNYKNGNRRVVFHSREIRKKEGPFNPRIIDINQLQEDIADMITNTPFVIYSSTIDKFKYVDRYAYPFPVYDLCLDFIVERFCRQLNRENKTGALLLESRGKKEDKKILKHLINLLENGNRYHNPSHFSCIKKVFFNPKWCQKHNYEKSFIQLELADLISYPIHKFNTTGTEDKAFKTFKDKLYNYPNFNGYGIKTFP